LKRLSAGALMTINNLTANKYMKSVCTLFRIGLSLFQRYFMKIIGTILLLISTFPGVQAQVLTDSLRVGANYRTFHFNSPKALSLNASLIFVLHGSGGNGLGMMKRTAGLEQITEKENALVVYPDGYKRYWNECRKEASSFANKENIDENTFFSSMIGYFIRKYNINENHVFCVGTSGGGHMCYKLAMTMPKNIKAITAIIANLPDDDNMDCVESKIAVPVMIVNGTADPLNPYGGGVMESADFKMGRVRSTDRSFHYWASLAGYTGEPKKEILPDTDPNDGKTIERYIYKESGKPEVILLKVIGGKHDYPNDIDVHVEAWTFFKRQLK
jgi:polyhydroxybutyrate depolymerase